MKNQRLIQLGAVGLAVVLLAAAGSFLKPLDAHRQAMGLSAIEDVSSMPPQIAFTSLALGGFRGLAVDYFWIRAEMLKQQGRLYEANQLAHWICTLQPRFPRVWSFQAWNLAYNISVMTQTFKERWNWVHNAITLLRDEGIRYNPKSVSLYRELGWIFFHKMGDFMDDFHLGYKRQWAWDMYRVLGEPPADIQAEGAESVHIQLGEILAEKTAAADNRPPYRQRTASAEEADKWKDKHVQQVIAWFAEIAEAPRTWAALAGDPAMGPFLERCRRSGIKLWARPSAANLAAEVEPNPEFFDEYQIVLTPTFRQQFDVQAGRIQLTADAAALRDLLNDPEFQPQARQLLAFLRRHMLVSQYKMDPAWMLHLMQRFGPIDWRLPDAHGMYWSSFGVHQVEQMGVKDVEEFFGPNTSLNTDRMMLFALQRVTSVGRLFFEPNVEQIETSVFDTLPDLRFVSATNKAYIATAAKYDPDSGAIAGEDFRDGHQNYLRDAIRYFYLYGQQDIAAYYYEYLRTHYRLRDGRINEDYMRPLDEFVLDPEFTDRLTDPRVAEVAIASYLYQAMQFMLMGQNDTATGLIGYARNRLYGAYMKMREDTPNERMKLPPFEVIFNNAVKGRLVAGGGVANPDMLFIKARLWKTLPLQTQLAVYDGVIGPLGEQAKLVQREQDLDSLFPPPPGLEQYRVRAAAAEEARQAEQGAGQQPVQSAEELKQRSRQGEQDRARGRMLPTPR